MGTSSSSAEEEARRQAEEERKRQAAIRAHQTAIQSRVDSANRVMGLIGRPDIAPIDSGGNIRDWSTNELMGTISRLSNMPAAVTGGAPPEVTEEEACDLACQRAAKKAAEKARRAKAKAERKARKKAEREARKAKARAERERRKAKREQRRRDRRTKRQRQRDRREQALKDRSDELEAQGERLSERGQGLADEQERLDAEEGRLREAEGEARRNDPNCRGTACQNARAARAENSRAISDLAKASGEFQADMAGFQGQAQSHARDVAKLNKMKDAGWGMSQNEWNDYQAEKQQIRAHGEVAAIQRDIAEMKRRQQEVREKGGSGSKTDRQFQDKINDLENKLTGAEQFATAADQTAFQAKAYNLGFKEQYDAYAKIPDAISARDAADKAINDRNSAEDRLARLEKEGASQAEINKAKRAVAQSQRDVKSTTRLADKIDPRPQSDIRKEANNFINEFTAEQHQRSLTDAQLNEQVAIQDTALKRIDQAVDSIGGVLPPPSGPLYDKQKKLQADKMAQQAKLDEIDKSLEDLMGRGPVMSDVAEYFAKKRGAVLKEINGIDAELGNFSVLDQAEGFAGYTNAVNDALGDYFAGLPTDKNGNIDEVELAKQIGVVGKAQMELSKIGGQMKALDAKIASGAGLTPAEQAQRAQLQNDMTELTDGLKGFGVNVSYDKGKFSTVADSFAAAVTWDGATDAVVEIVDKVNQTKVKVASLRNQPPPTDTLSGPAPAVPGPRAAKPKTVSPPPVAARSSVAKDPNVTRARPQAPPETLKAPPGGTPKALGAGVADVSARLGAAGGGVISGVITQTKKAAPTRVTEEELALRRKGVEMAKARTKEAAKDARQANRDADQAEKEAKEARRDSDEARQSSDGYGASRERQAGEYQELAKVPSANADSLDAKAAHLRDRAGKMRETADRYDKLASTTTDTSLAANARESARNARQRAGELDDRARERDGEADRERELSRERADRAAEIKAEADKLEADAKSAEEETAQKEAAAAELQQQAALKEFDLEKARYDEARQKGGLQRAQAVKLNSILKNPPPAEFWEGLNSGDRMAWMRDNVPDWDNLSNKDQVDVLRNMDFAESRVHAVDAAKAYDKFVKDKNITQAGMDERDARIKDLVKKIEEKEDELIISSDDRNEIRGLKGKLLLERRRYQSDLREFSKLRDDVVEKSYKAKRLEWSLVPDSRQKEIDGRVNELAKAKGQLQLAKAAAVERDIGFVERLSKIRGERAAAALKGDTDAVARHDEALDRLEAAQTSWREIDTASINTLEKVVNSRRERISLDSAYDNLGEIGDEAKLDKAADDMLANSNAVKSRLAGQANSVRQTIDQIDLGGADFDPARAVVDAYDTVSDATGKAATTAGVVAGGVYGFGKGVVTGIVGMGKMFIWEPIDSVGEDIEMLVGEPMEAVFGWRTNFYGTDNQEFVQQATEDPGKLMMKMVLGQAKPIYEGVQNIETAYAFNDPALGFEGAVPLGQYVGENLVEPEIALGYLGAKVGKLKASMVDDVPMPMPIRTPVPDRPAPFVPPPKAGGAGPMPLPVPTPVPARPKPFTP
ncbi:MAG: hypothetical protein ACE5FR_13475, partial [Rhodospirillales bacterium]